MAQLVSLDEAAKSSGGILAGTGHRPEKIGGYKTPNPTFSKVEKHVYHVLDLLKPEKVVSGMALGFDTILFNCAVARGIPTIAAVPFEGFHGKWPEASQAAYFAMLKKASEIKYVCELGYAPWKMQKRNEWMVDIASLILGCWDGTPGGTKNCLDYANVQDDDLVIVVFDPTKL